MQQEGFSVRILDMRLTDYRYYRVNEPVFVGISCMSGRQIMYALDFARYVRQKNFNSNSLGWHTSYITARTNGIQRFC
ncbi:MAG: hypothetical protein WDA42_06835 [Candidatus Bathyarchaeia archaeon]